MAIQQPVPYTPAKSRPSIRFGDLIQRHRLTRENGQILVIGLVGGSGELQELPRQASSVRSIALGDQLAVTGAADGRVVVWRLGESALSTITSVHRSVPAALAFDVPGATIASGDLDAGLVIWNGEDGALAGRTLKSVRDMIEHEAINATGDLLALAGDTGDVLFWDVRTGAPLRPAVLSGKRIAALGFVHADTLVALAGDGELTMNQRAIECTDDPNGQSGAIACADVGGQ
jgi:WD40 repeat protein